MQIANIDRVQPDRLKFAWFIGVAVSLAGLFSLQILPYGDLDFPGVFMDSYEYLNMADFFSPWHALTNPRAVESLSTNQFPPLYPLVLALFGGGTQHVQAAYLIHSVICCALLALAICWMLKMRVPAGIALLSCTLLCLTPWYFIATVRLSSEPLFICLMLAAFIRAEQAVFSTKFDTLLVALVALACLTRSAGLFLLVSLVISVWLQSKSFRLTAAHATAAFAPAGIWLAYKASFPAAHNYGELGAARLTDMNLSALQYLQSQATAMLFAVSPGSGEHLSEAILAILLLIAAARVWWLRVKDKRLDAYFLLAYFPIVLFWPFPADTDRLATPIVIVLIGYSLMGIFESVRSRTRYAVSLLFCSLLLLVPASSTAIRSLTPIDQELVAYKKSDFFFLAEDADQATSAVESIYRVVSTLRELPNVVPVNECVFASQSRLSAYYANRVFVQPEYRPFKVQQSPHCRFVFYSILASANDKRIQEKIYQLAQNGEVLLINQVNELGVSRTIAIVTRLPGAKRENR